MNPCHSVRGSKPSFRLAFTACQKGSRASRGVPLSVGAATFLPLAMMITSLQHVVVTACHIRASSQMVVVLS